MDFEYSVEVNNVAMIYNMNVEKIDNFKEYILKLAKRQLFFKEFMALQDISFKVKKGEVFGLVGLNGAGKSTLLKIIAGVLKPTRGEVIVRGNMAPLIELGAGFNSELTGRENIFLNGAVLGYSNKFMKENFDEILDFSELHSFIDVPIKNYSSGMVSRLAFSIATIINPEILIVDEVLAVGDFKFREKCEKKMKDLLGGGTTVLLVSHSISQIEELCSRALWLEKGKIKMIGDVKEVCSQYKRN